MTNLCRTPVDWWALNIMGLFRTQICVVLCIVETNFNSNLNLWMLRHFWSLAKLLLCFLSCRKLDLKPRTKAKHTIVIRLRSANSRCQRWRLLFTDNTNTHITHTHISKLLKPQEMIICNVDALNDLIWENAPSDSGLNRRSPVAEGLTVSQGCQLSFLNAPNTKYPTLSYS